jgi:hypothetical protein
MDFNKRRETSSIVYWRISRSWIVLPHTLIEQPRETRINDLGSQPREVWKQPGRLPVEGKLGSSENTSSFLFCCLLCSLCICATCLAFGAQYPELLNQLFGRKQTFVSIFSSTRDQERLVPQILVTLIPAGTCTSGLSTLL